MMNKGIIQLLKNQLDSLVQSVREENIEFWFARDLQELIGYLRLENFITSTHREP